jgi:hypothetical protein
VAQTLRRILAPEVLQQPGPGGPRHGAAIPGNQRRAQPTADEKRRRFEALSAAVHKLQTEAFLDRKDLDALPLAQLKVLCCIQGLQCMPPSIQDLKGSAMHERICNACRPAFGNSWRVAPYLSNAKFRGIRQSCGREAWC